MWPALPPVRFVSWRDRGTLDAADAFAWVRHVRLTLSRGDDGAPQEVDYDVVERRATDASIIVPYFVDGAGRARVYLVSAVRPPVELAHGDAFPSALWELPAGLIERGETPAAAAQRELAEEVGFHVALDALVPLGADVAPAPALVGEVQRFFRVEVDPSARTPPAGDGSVLEAWSTVADVDLDAALDACANSKLVDGKTELGLRRLEAALRRPAARP